MKRFRVAHPRVEPAKTPKGEPANLLMPLWQVKVDRYAGN
jgi:hypothetical protein